MRSARPVASAPLVFALLAGCTAGSGPATQLPSEKREAPGTGSEPAAGGPEFSGTSRDNAGGTDRTSGGSTAAACPACDYVYSCAQDDGVSTVTDSVTLVTRDHQCVVLDSTTTIFNCDGTLVFENPRTPTTTVHWTPSGDGGFSFQVPPRNIVCSPDKPYVTTPSP